MRQWDIQICQAWYSHCNVEWAIIDAVSSFVVAVATVAAVLVAIRAWKKAKALDRKAARRLRRWEKRDAMALAVVMRSELQYCRFLLRHTLPEEGGMDFGQRFRSLRTQRYRLELPLLRTALTSLGCFDGKVALALGKAFSKAPLIHCIVPREEIPPDGVESLMRYIDTMSTDAIALCEEAERLLAEFLEPPTPTIAVRQQ